MTRGAYLHLYVGLVGKYVWRECKVEGRTRDGTHNVSYRLTDSSLPPPPISPPSSPFLFRLFL